MPFLKLLLFVLMLLMAPRPAHSMRLVFSEGIGSNGFSCMNMLMRAFKGPAAGFVVHQRLQPLYGYTIDPRAAGLMHVNFLMGVVLDHALEMGSFTDAERALVLAVRNHLGAERRLENVGAISKTQHPEIFAAAGEHRIAVTGDHVGDPIFFDLDRVGDLNHAELVSQLFHEFAHHHGVKDDASRFLDQLGDKVGRLLGAEVHSFGHLGLDHFVTQRFELTLAQTPAHTAEELRGREQMHMHDHGFGSHLLLHDGTQSFDVREMLRTQFFDEQQLVMMLVNLGKWRMQDEYTAPSGLAVGKVLILDAGLETKVLNVTEKSLEVVFPLIVDEGGKLRVDTSAQRYPFAVERKNEREQTLHWLWGHLGPGSADEVVTAKSFEIKTSDAGEKTLVMSFSAKPGLRWRANPFLMWIYDSSVEGTPSRTLLTREHSLANVPGFKVSAEESTSGNYWVQIPLPDTEVKTPLQLAAVQLYSGGWRSIVVPPLFPRLGPAVGDAPAPLQVSRLLDESGAHVSELSFKAGASASRDFNLEVLVPENFGVQSFGDFAKFGDSFRTSGSLEVVFENDHEKLVSIGGAAYVKRMFWLALRYPGFRPGEGDFRDHGVMLGDSPLGGSVPNGMRVLTLPLRLRMERFMHTENRPAMYWVPPRLIVKTLVLTDGDLNVWRIPTNFVIKLSD